MVARLMLVIVSEQLISLMNLVLAHFGCSAIKDIIISIMKSGHQGSLPKHRK